LKRTYMSDREVALAPAQTVPPTRFGAGAPLATSDETMLEFLIQLAERKRLIAIVTGSSLFIGLILCLVLPVRYTATTEIMPPKQTQSISSLLNSQLMVGSLAEAAGGGLLTNPNEVYIGLLKSRPVADTIIHEFHLLTVYRAKDMTAARRELAKRTNIFSQPSTMISVSVSDPDKARAAAMANAYIEQLRALTGALSMTEAGRRRVFFQNQLNNEKEALIAAEENFQDVQQKRGLVHLDTQADEIIRSVASLRGQIEAKEVEVQALRTYSTDRNPDVQLAEDELATLQKQAARLQQNDSPSTFSSMGLKNVPKAGMDYIRAQREAQYQQALFDVLMKQYEAAKLDEAKEAAVIQVVEPAIPPDRKTSPRPLLILALSLVLGFFLGCLAALLLHRIDLEKADPEGSVALQRLQVALKR
jgi:tyrosine-protein kinase Etk/Wzc